MQYDIMIPQWSEGKPLHIRNIEALTPQEAREKVITWVNRRAGYHYCDELPKGCTVKLAQHKVG